MASPPCRQGSYGIGTRTAFGQDEAVVPGGENIEQRTPRVLLPAETGIQLLRALARQQKAREACTLDEIGGTLAVCGGNEAGQGIVELCLDAREAVLQRFGDRRVGTRLWHAAGWRNRTARAPDSPGGHGAGRR
jgi:hypothetical protein